MKTPGMNRFVFLVVCMACSFPAMSQNSQFPNYTLYNPPEYEKEVPIKGNPLLFDSAWAHAKVVTANNKIIQNDSLFFNLEKISQNLLLTQDYKKIYEVDKREFKSVTFFWHDSVYIFEHVYLINKKDFFQELIRNDNKYSLYKFIHTTIKSQNWHTNGLVTEGKLYSQFVDNPVYYIILPNKEYKVLNEIKKKSIDRAFKLNGDNMKVDEWLSTNKNGVFGEDDLWKLILYLNG
jgi:hypothetical protein